MRIGIAFIVLLLAAPSWAADLSWRVDGVPGTFSSPSAACQAWITSINANRPPGATHYTLGSVVKIGPTQYRCPLVYQGVEQVGAGEIAKRPSDFVCPPENDDSTGECTPPPPPDPCEPLAGSTSSFFATVPNGGTSLPGEYVCSNACRATWSGQCGSNSEGVSACWGLATFTGEACQSGDTPTGIGTPPVDPTDPDPTDPSNNCGPGYTWSGTTCVPSDPTDPTDPTDPADPTDPTDPTDPSNPGGGSTDPGNSGGDGNGNGNGSGDGDGNGSGDGNGNGNGNGNGSGSGSGTGNGDKDDGKEEEEQKSSVGGESCTAELKCEGDAIQCAILRKNKEQLCQWKYDEGVRGSIAAELSGPDYQLQEKSVGVGSLFNDALNKGRWLPSACPAPESFSVMGRSYSFSWEPVCRLATAMGPLIVALASIFFAVSIGRALKGS